MKKATILLLFLMGCEARIETKPAPPMATMHQTPSGYQNVLEVKIRGHDYLLTGSGYILHDEACACKK